jgi:hypothetical protein
MTTYLHAEEYFFYNINRDSNVAAGLSGGKPLYRLRSLFFALFPQSAFLRFICGISKFGFALISPSSFA